MSVHLNVLRDALKRWELHAYRETIEAWARPTHLMEVRPSRAPALGRSRLGGCPDLPEDVVWPQSEFGHLEFLAQIDLAKLPHSAHGLPLTGFLWLFSETDGACDNEHALIYRDVTPAELERRPLPPVEQRSEEEWSIDPERPLEVVRFHTSASLPFHQEAHEMWSDAVLDRYYEMASELLKLGEESASKLLGYPSVLFEHLDVTPEALFAREDLLTIESHFVDGVCFACFWDAGTLALDLPRDGLREMSFDDSEVRIFSF